MSVQARLLTYDDLRRMPDDGNRHELIGGELYVALAPSRAHQRIGDKLHRLVGDFVEQNNLGWFLYAPVDVRLTPPDVVQPDLLFLRQDRLDIYQERGDVDGAPDLVVEIVSPSSEKIDPGAKMRLYAASGIPEYWLVDPMTHRFQLFVLRTGRYEEMAVERGRLRSEAIRDLVIEPAALFPVLEEE